MNTVTFDTHRFITQLQKSGFTTEQAEGVSDALGHALQATDVATKGDLRQAVAELNIRIESVKSDIIKWVASLLVIQAAAVATLMKLL